MLLERFAGDGSLGGNFWSFPLSLSPLFLETLDIPLGQLNWSLSLLVSLLLALFFSSWTWSILSLRLISAL